MRALLLAPLLLVCLPAFAEDLPAGVERLMTCGHVYSLRSQDAKDAGDEGGATEFYYMADNLLWQARTTLEQAGLAAEAIDNVLANNAITTGLDYGFGNGDTMFAECIAAEDTP